MYQSSSWRELLNTREEVRPLPPYTYRCPDCEQMFETVVAQEGASVVQTCPRCRKTTIQQAPSSVAQIGGGESCGNDDVG